MAALSALSSTNLRSAAANLTETVTAMADDGTARSITVECTLAVLGTAAGVVPTFGGAAELLLNKLADTFEAMNENDKLTKHAHEKLKRVHGTVEKAIANRQRDPEADVSSFQKYIHELEELAMRADK